MPQIRRLILPKPHPPDVATKYSNKKNNVMMQTLVTATDVAHYAKLKYRPLLFVGIKFSKGENNVTMEMFQITTGVVCYARLKGCQASLFVNGMIPAVMGHLTTSKV